MPHVELPQAEFKVVMLGDTFTGKTSLVLRFAEGYYRDSARNATVGAFFITKRLTVQGITCKIQIWDTAGQEQFKRLAPMYYKNAAAAIVCYDVTSPKSFETLKYWIDELQQNVHAGGIVLAMCATKCDLATHPDTSQAEELAQAAGAMYMTTSAKTNDNVTALFERVAEQVLQFQNDSDENQGIPMAFATTVDTRERNASVDMNGRTPSAASTMTPLSASPRAKSPMEGKRQRHNSDSDDDDVVDPAVVVDSSADVHPRCDANMLMCGDVLKAHQDLMQSGNGQGCAIL